jgi:excinuclease ABC subunit C
LLIDGGKGHISAVNQVLQAENIYIPVFGMVKDDYHKTRALCTESQEINIAKEKAIYMLIYKIQEEVHRYTVGITTNAKRKTLKHSSLEKINGIGPQKARNLLLHFGTLDSVKKASIEELSKVKGISLENAKNIKAYFDK